MSLKSHRAAMRASFEREIIHAASEEFATRGLENFSMRRLSARMGCAVGTVYLYFDDKQDLLNAVVEDSFRLLNETLQASAAAAAPGRMLHGMVRAYVNFGLEHPHHYRCAFALSGTMKSKHYKPHAAFDHLRKMVSQGVKAGVFLSNDVELVSQTIWAATHGLTSLLIVRPNFPWASTEALMDSLADTLLHGLFVAGRVSRKRKHSSKQST